MSRRVGQAGSVFQQPHQAAWSSSAPTYGRFWIDSPTGRRRRVITLGRCPTRTAARRKLRDIIDREGINSVQTFTQTTSGTSFRQQAETWIASLPHRRRRPVKAATIWGWRQALDKWVLPCIGNMPLSEVSNAALKKLIETMAAGGLGPKTIVNYILVPKMVLASVVNAEGEQLYPRKWNHEFIGLPIVQKEQQHRPTVTEADVTSLIGRVPLRFAVLFALLAGTGLRAGEALALKASDFTPDFRVLHVTRSIWHGQEQSPKTPAAVREIDVAEPLASVLRTYAEGKTGYLFATKSGRPLAQRNVHRAAGVGLHAFRRFRIETLRRARVPEDLIGLWLGHAPRSVTDQYAVGLRLDRAWRREWVQRAGLGFTFGLYGARSDEQLALQQAA